MSWGLICTPKLVLIFTTLLKVPQSSTCGALVAPLRRRSNDERGRYGDMEKKLYHLWIKTTT